MGNLLPFNNISCSTTCQSDPDCDYEDGRRQILKYVQHRLEKPDPNKVRIIEKYMEIPDGRILFTKCYFPLHMKPKAMVFYLCGYAVNIDRPGCHDHCLRLARNGYIVCAHDHLGYGRSDGLWLYIPNDFDTDYVDNAKFIHDYCKRLYIRDDVNHSKLGDDGEAKYTFSDAHVLSSKHEEEEEDHDGVLQNGIKDQMDDDDERKMDKEPMVKTQALVPWSKEDLSSIDEGNKYFLCGRSMGGAVATRLAMKYPTDYKGMILCCPMIEIDDTVKPAPWIIEVFRKLVSWFPRLEMAPNKDLRPYMVSTERGKMLCNKNDTMLPDRQPRLKTAYEMVMTTEKIQEEMDLVTMDFIVLHGLADRVTNPQVSKNLYDRRKDHVDATLRLYEDTWHMIWHEPKGEEMHSDILHWLDEKSK